MFRTRNPKSRSNRSGYSGGFNKEKNYTSSSSYFRASGTSNRRPNNRPLHDRGRAFRSEPISVSKFIQRSSNEAEPAVVTIEHSFADFAFSPILHTNLQKRGFLKPTPIQDQAIRPLLDGRDVIGLANTGTGKTAAFLLPLINKVHLNKSEKVLIIAPTRELAQQIEGEFRLFSLGMGQYSTVCVGGLPIYRQIANLRRSPQFVIGTPGRLKDLGERGIIEFNAFNSIVLDEVDRMLDMGFVDDIRRILNQLPAERQSLFFSATMPTKIRDLVSQFTSNPVTIEVKSGDTARNVVQDVVRVGDGAVKIDLLHEILLHDTAKKVLVFAETKMEVERLASNLAERGFKADSIHGDKKQHQRQSVLSKFKNDMITILVATDVAARGLDVSDITHVINYTIPQTYDDYVHRIGRTGRGDKKGLALTFVG